MVTFITGYINDLSAVKDNITLRLRILRAWMQPLYGKLHVKNLELIVLDKHFNDFLNTCADHGKIILVLQLAMMKIWDGKICVQNGYKATKLFLFDATQPIMEEEFQDAKEYSSYDFNIEDVEKSENTATRVSANSKNSTKETFICKNPPRNIVKLFDVAQDLESQTDEKTTHVSTQKNNVVDHVKQQHASDEKNKRAAGI
ncbi:hypothetical protein Tco_0951828 [Tanacetum coccineum]|uniref:Uncharacterized protein n=1 Tax=Tanacetum coccineum TaxID=301880 RepID=A0ABQ5DX28_9ASTR